MVITDVNQVAYQGNGSNTAFPFTFRIIDKTDIKLLLIDEDGTETDIDSDFYVDTENNTVYYPGYAAGAEPPLADQPAPVQTGQRLVVYRELPITQEKDLGEKWPFNVIELALDKLTMILQQLFDWWGRTLKVSQGKNITEDVDLTVPMEPGTVITVNDDGTGFDDRKAILEVNGHWEGKNMPIRNVAGPGMASDAATKEYVDTVLDGYSGQGERLKLFDTVAQMRVANLIPSQVATTQGYADISDGGAAAYIIRAKSASDVDNEDTIIFLDNGNVAEKIYINPYHHCYFMPVANNTNDYTGECSLIKTRNGKTIMFDTGMTNSYPLIKATLTALGITKIDYFVLSHYHGDHWYNLRSMVNDFDFTETVCYLPKVSSVYPTMQEDILDYITDNTKIYPDSGDTFTVEDIKFTFFNCDQADIDYYDSLSADYNNYSMCTYAECGEKRILFTGDIYPTAQERMYNQEWFKKTHVLNVPHHGVNYTVFTPYLQEVMPDLSVVSSPQNLWEKRCVGTPEAQFLSQVGELYLLGDGLVDVSFNKDVVQYNAVGDKKFGIVQSNEEDVTLYLDSDYEGFSNGTPLHPFKSILDAAGVAQKLYNKLNVLIQPLSGTYISNEIVFFRNCGNKITIKDISIGSLAISSCKEMILTNVTVTGGSNIPLYIEASTILNSTVEVNGYRSGSGYDSRGVGIYRSMALFNTLTVKNRSCALYVAESSNVNINSFVGGGIDYVLADTVGSVVTIGSYNDNVCPQLYGDIAQQNPLRGFTAIEYVTSNTDLNNLKKLGAYRISSDTIMQTLSHKPSDSLYAGTLYVTNIAQGIVLEQKLDSDWLDSNSWSGTWIRRYNPGTSTWSDWRKITTV